MIEYTKHDPRNQITKIGYTIISLVNIELISNTNNLLDSSYEIPFVSQTQDMRVCEI